MLRPILPVFFAVAASFLTISSVSAACDLECPEGTVCGVEPEECSSPGYDPDAGGAPDGGVVCSGEREVCLPAPCADASECPVGWSCDDPTATCSMGSDGVETCESTGETVCVAPPGDAPGEEVEASDASATFDLSSPSAEEEDESVGGCTMGAGTPSGGALGLLAMFGMSVLARRRRS